MIVILFVFLYFAFIATWNSIKESKSIDFDFRIKNLEGNNRKKCDQINNDDPAEPINNVDHKTDNFIEENDLEEKLLPKNNEKIKYIEI